MTSPSSRRGRSPAASTNTASPPTRRVDDFAQREVDYILGVGGIELRTASALGRDFTLADLRRDYDAVFLGLGLGGVNALGIDERSSTASMNAVDLHRGAAPGARIWRHCRSAAASSSSAAA